MARLKEMYDYTHKDLREHQKRFMAKFKEIHDCTESTSKHLFIQKRHVFTQKRRIFTQKRRIFTQKRRIFTQKRPMTILKEM